MCPFERMKDRSSIVRVECFKSTNTIKTPGHTPRDTHPPHLLHQGGPQVKPPLVALIARRRQEEDAGGVGPIRRGAIGNHHLLKGLGSGRGSRRGSVVLLEGFVR